MARKPRKFSGFPPGKLNMVQLPAPFFSKLLPLVDDLAELKVLLFCFWALPQKEGEFRYLRHTDFLHNESLMAGLQIIEPEAEPEAILDAALERAITRAALLRAEVTLEEGSETLYFVNTPRGQQAVAQVDAGNWRPGDSHNPVEILPERPTIYAIYEANVGPLTPIIADELKDLEQTYAAIWIVEAIRIAVENNKRNLRYIRAILTRWEEEGRSTDEIAQRRPEEDGKRYVSGKYGDLINH